MIENIKLLTHSAIRIEKNDGKIIYIDPFNIGDEYKNDADYIFITHSHYDHFSYKDILKIRKEETKFVVPNDKDIELAKLNTDELLVVKPSEKYIIDDIQFETVPAYNIDKKFHRKEFNWVGYIIEIDGKKIYIAGDTDNTYEAQSVKCDIAMVPVGGTYTMTSKEAAELIKIIKPKVAIPTHYGSVVGNVNDAHEFKKILDGYVDVEIMIK